MTLFIFKAFLWPLSVAVLGNAQPQLKNHEGFYHVALCVTFITSRLLVPVLKISIFSTIDILERGVGGDF